MIPGRVNPHDTFPCRFSRRKVQLETFQMGPFQMMRYGHCKNRYGDVVVRACGNIVVSWCQHVDPEDLDNILTTWCYGMTNAWLTSFVQRRRKIQLRTMLRKLRNHLGNMKFHSGRVRVTPIYPNLDDTAQWVFPEDVEYLEGVVKENDMHVQSMDQA